MTAEIIITAVVSIAVLHIYWDVHGVPIGTQVRYCLRPFVWLLFIISIGWADFRKCKGCKEREEHLNRLFGKNP